MLPAWSTMAFAGIPPHLSAQFPKPRAPSPPVSISPPPCTRQAGTLPIGHAHPQVQPHGVRALAGSLKRLSRVPASTDPGWEEGAPLRWTLAATLLKLQGRLGCVSLPSVCPCPSLRVSPESLRWPRGGSASSCPPPPSPSRPHEPRLGVCFSRALDQRLGCSSLVGAVRGLQQERRWGRTGQFPEPGPKKANFRV